LFSDLTGGRAESAAASLRKSGSRSVLFCALLFFSSLILTSGSSYVYKAPLTGLFLLVFLLLLHTFFFVPFMLTVFPPQRKRKPAARKKPIVKPSKSKEVLNVDSNKTERNSDLSLNKERESLENITSI